MQRLKGNLEEKSEALSYSNGVFISIYCYGNVAETAGEKN